MDGLAWLGLPHAPKCLVWIRNWSQCGIFLLFALSDTKSDEINPHLDKLIRQHPHDKHDLYGLVVLYDRHGANSFTKGSGFHNAFIAWSIWKWRNHFVFNSNQPNMQLIVSIIEEQAHAWAGRCVWPLVVLPTGAN